MARRHFAALGIASVVILAGCVPPQGDNRSPAPSSATGALAAPRGAGGDLQILYWQAPSTLNPHLATGPKDSDASRLVLEPLASLGKDGQAIANGLAAEIPTVANGGDAQKLYAGAGEARPGGGGGGGGA